MLKYILSIGILFIIIGNIFGQKTCFSAKETIGCAPFTVQLESCSKEGRVVYKYGDGTSFSSDTTHTYSLPGNYAVKQYAGNPPDSSNPTIIRVVSNPEPIAEIIACDQLGVYINITTSEFDFYTVSFGDGQSDTLYNNKPHTHIYKSSGSKKITIKGEYFLTICTSTYETTIDIKEDQFPVDFTTIAQSNKNIEFNFSGSNEFYSFDLYTTDESNSLKQKELSNIEANKNSIFSIDNNEELNYFFVEKTDNCGHKKQSPTYHNLPFNITIDAEKNHLISLLYPARETTQLSINNEIITLSPTQIEYLDSNFSCGAKPCYTLTQKTNNVSNTSINKCVESQKQSLPSILTNVYITHELTSNKIHWQKKQDENISYYILTEEIKGDTQQFNTAELEQILPSKQKCYSLAYVNHCELTSPTTNYICPLWVIQDENNPHNYEWEKPKSVEIDYYWIIITTNGIIDSIKTKQNQYSLNLEESENYTIQIIAVPKDPKLPSIESDIFEFKNLEYANLPNTIILLDEVNGFFYPIGKSIINYEIDFFSEAGNFVNSVKNTPWDGKHQTEYVETGTYVYIASIIYASGKEEIQKGTLTVLR